MKFSSRAIIWLILTCSVLGVGCRTSHGVLHDERVVDRVARQFSQLTTYDLHLYDTIYPFHICAAVDSCKFSQAFSGQTPIIRHAQFRGVSTNGTSDTTTQTHAAVSYNKRVQRQGSFPAHIPAFSFVGGLLVGVFFGAIILHFIVKMFG